MLLPLPTLAFQSWVAIDPSKPEGSPPEISILEHNDDFTRLTVKIPGFWCEEVYTSGGIFQRISVPVYGTKMVDGKPELPVVRGLLAHNPTKEASMIEVLSADWQDFYNYLIYPHQPENLLEEAPPPFEWDQEFYGQDIWYPGDEVLLSDPGKIRNVHVVNNHIQCFQYNPLMGHLKVASEMEVKVTYQTPEFGGGGAEGELTYGVHKDFIPMLESCVWNFNEIGFYPTSAACDYLIITANDYERALAPLVALLSERGYTVDVVTMNEIPKAVGALGIYSYINYRYDVDRITYVLLVGDVQDYTGSQLEPLNPNRMVPIPYWLPGRYDYYPPYLSPSDVCYACLDRPDPPNGSPPSDQWDDWWESSLCDWYPDVYVGRFCADNISQVQSAVNKTIYYERRLDSQNPGLTDSNWYDKMLFVAYKKDYEHLQEPDFFYNTLNDIMNDSYDIELPEITLLWGETPGVSNDTVMEDIKNGCSIVNYHGHGGWQDWGTGDEYVGWTNYGDHYPDPGPYVHFYEVPHVKDLDNQHLVVAFNVGCNMACIDGQWGDSLCDYWLRIPRPLIDPYQGGVAAVGATRFGTFDDDRALEKALFHTMYGTTEDGWALAVPMNVLGAVHYGTLARLFADAADTENGWSIEHRLQYFYHHIILGEPSLEIRNEYTEQGPTNNPRVELHLNKLPIKLSVYPNPGEGLFTLSIEGSGADLKEIKVYDLSGRLVEKITIPQSEMTPTSLTDTASKREVNMDLSTLSQGLYILGVGEENFAKVVICK